MHSSLTQLAEVMASHPQSVAYPGKHHPSYALPVWSIIYVSLHGTKNFKTPHLAVVFSREHRPGGIEYVGLKPTALTHKPDGKPVTCVSLVFPDGSGSPVLLDVERIEYIDFLA